MIRIALSDFMPQVCRKSNRDCECGWNKWRNSGARSRHEVFPRDEAGDVAAGWRCGGVGGGGGRAGVAWWRRGSARWLPRLPMLCPPRPIPSIGGRLGHVLRCQRFCLCGEFVPEGRRAGTPGVRRCGRPSARRGLWPVRMSRCRPTHLMHSKRPSHSMSRTRGHAIFSLSTRTWAGTTRALSPTGSNCLAIRRRARRGKRTCAGRSSKSVRSTISRLASNSPQSSARSRECR